MAVEAVRFDVHNSVVLGVTGNGTVTFRPSNEKWEVDRIYVKCSPLPGENAPVREAVCRVYQGQEHVGRTVCDTQMGSTGDTATGTPFYLTDGETVFIVWSGGDAGVTATVSMSGWKSAPQGGFRAVR